MTILTDDEDYAVVLDDDAVKELESAYGIQPAAKAEAPAKAKAEAAAKADPAPVKAPETDLLRRLQAAEQRAADERAKRIEAERLAHDRGTTVAVSKAQAAESDYHAVANALTKAEADVLSLKAAHRAALEAGDYEAASNAAEKMAEIKAKQIQLGEGKAALEDRVRAARAEAERATKSEAPKADLPADPLEQFLVASNMPPRAQAWFRSHPECAPTTDKAKYYQALAAHESILKTGVADGSDDYYAKLDQAMGFGVSDKTDEITRDEDDREADVAVDKAPKAQPKRVAAPVARDSVMQRRADGKIQLRLTKEQAVMADELGMTRSDYAKFLLQAEQEGRLSGNYDL